VRDKNTEMREKHPALARGCGGRCKKDRTVKCGNREIGNRISRPGGKGGGPGGERLRRRGSCSRLNELPPEASIGRLGQGDRNRGRTSIQESSLPKRSIGKKKNNALSRCLSPKEKKRGGGKKPPQPTDPRPRQKPCTRKRNYRDTVRQAVPHNHHYTSTLTTYRLLPSRE